MGILGRLSTLIKSNVNDVIDSMQDPAKEIVGPSMYSQLPWAIRTEPIDLGDGNALRYFVDEQFRTATGEVMFAEEIYHLLLQGAQATGNQLADSHGVWNPANRPAFNASQSCFSSLVCSRRSRRAF